MARCAREIAHLCLPDPPDTPGRAAGRVPGGVRMGPGVTTGARERRWMPSWPVDLTTTLGVLSHGRGDPTIRIVGGEVWRATRTPHGPATIHYRRDGAEVLARAWGPGAEHELEVLPRVLGARDDPAGFDADAHPVMAAAFRRFGPGWRVLHTERVLEALVPAVLEQRVTGREASRAWAELVRAFGEPAPGPAGSGPAERPGTGPGRTGSGRGVSVGGPAPGRGAGRSRLDADPELGLASGGSRPRTRAHHRHGGRTSRLPGAAVRARTRTRPGRPCARCPGSGSGRLPRSGSGPGGIATRCPSATSTWPGRSCTH